tara:strand:- start:371 stop:592 length:222 start_codon:yes stop_codon:yes gene_type:complete
MKKIIDKNELKDLTDMGLPPEYIKENFQIQKKQTFTHEQVKQYAIRVMAQLDKLDTKERQRVLQFAIKYNNTK